MTNIFGGPKSSAICAEGLNLIPDTGSGLRFKMGQDLNLKINSR